MEQNNTDSSVFDLLLNETSLIAKDLRILYDNCFFFKKEEDSFFDEEIKLILTSIDQNRKMLDAKYSNYIYYLNTNIKYLTKKALEIIDILVSDDRFDRNYYYIVHKIKDNIVSIEVMLSLDDESL